MSRRFGDEGRESYDTTDSSALYRKLHKYRLAGCPLCPWHGGENRSWGPRHTSWKRSRRRRWRVVREV
jgi:hypothetical protein